MPLIRPFAGIRPDPHHLAGVIAPPYDVLNTEEARGRAAGKPYSYLHISKPEIDLPPGTDPYDASVYEQGRENFRAMMAAGVIKRDPAPCYYFYQIVMGEHAQTGLVAVASCTEYANGRIRKHEYTQPAKEDDRVRQIDTLNAQTGPVFLTYPRSADIDAVTAGITTEQADADVTADDGVRHSLWAISDSERIDVLSGLFEALPRLYIADGHHRSAAAARIAERRRGANSGHTGDEPYNYFLSVIFPDNQVQILDYNRVIRDLNGMDASSFIDTLRPVFDIEKRDKPAKPTVPGEFAMYLAGDWYRLQVHRDKVPGDPVGRLDVNVLQEQVIGPVLGITDQRRDKRIDFVGGIRGLGELARRVDSGEMALAFAFFPTSLTDLMAVADAGQIMPTKSTWFEPKLADGMVSHALD